MVAALSNKAAADVESILAGMERRTKVDSPNNQLKRSLFVFHSSFTSPSSMTGFFNFCKEPFALNAGIAFSLKSIAYVSTSVQV